MRLALLALPLVGLMPLPVAAQTAPAQTFSLPAGCTAYLTVQMKSCTLSHHFTCEGDPEGWQRRIDLTPEGVTYFGTIDAETQWIESAHLSTGDSEKLEDNPADRASFSDLLATGTDSYDFQTTSDQTGTTRYVGQDTLTGRTVTIDGVTLDETQYIIVATDSGGGMIWQSEGNEFISREWRMFLSGKSTITTPADTFETDDSPMEFVRPGEPGFLAIMPKYGCTSIMSDLMPETQVLPASLMVQP